MQENGVIEILTIAKSARNQTGNDLIASLFNRPCFICGKAEWCKHREPEAVIAGLRALLGGMKRAREIIAKANQ
jgi:hypothetical protein